ncbi:MAG: hypothetical protein AB1749_15975 [Pseudomonadota bacterium]
MTIESAYLVVPFQRIGKRLGPVQAFMFDAPAPARLAAWQLAPRVAGVAILERRFDPETGDKDTVVAEIGLVPPAFVEHADWSVRLH